MNVQATKYELCDFVDPACELNAFIFLFKTNIEQYRDEW